MPADWSAPAKVPENLRSTVARMLAEAELADKPADAEAIGKWLASLAVLVVGGTMTGEDAQRKLRAYSTMLAGQVPLGALGRSTLDAAGRKFKFLPGYGEVAELLRTEASKGRERINRLRVLARSGGGGGSSPLRPPPENRRYDQLTAEEQAEFDRIMGQWKRQRGIGGLQALGEDSAA